MAYSGRRIDSLISLCIDYSIKNLANLKDIDIIKLLPTHIKDRMLHKFMSSAYFWKNVNFKRILSFLIHPMTKRIDLSLATIDDGILDLLKDCHNLRDVYLTRDTNENLTSQGIVNLLSRLKSLYLLQISNCSAVNDDLLICLSKNCLGLAALDVNGCVNVTDVGLQELSSLKNLQWVTFSYTKITNTGVEKLTSGPSGLNIKELRLANCKYITSDVLHIIIQHCPNIEVLVFYNLQPYENDHQTCFSLQEGSLKNLKQLTWTVQW